MPSTPFGSAVDKKYVLSSDYTIIPKSQWKYLHTKNIDPTTTTGIYNTKKNSVFVVNNTIGDLIRLFNKPTNGAVMLARYAKKLSLTEEKSQNKLVTLFLDLVKKKIIIEKNATRTQDANQHLKPYPIGTQIGQYTLKKRLNSNEHLHVFLVKNKTGKLFIIKMYPENNKLTQELRTNLHATLYREITILQYLKDEQYINKIVHYNNKKYFAVLEFFKGKSIKELVQSEKKALTFDQTLHITSQIMEVMRWIHSKNYIHGDIHDKNILVDSEHKIQLIDFGLAMHKTEEEIQNFRRGGIHLFMPPERIRSDVFSFVHKNPNFCSDVYQTGIILYILFYHKFPFTAATWKQKTKKIKAGSIRFYKYSFDKTTMPQVLIDFIKKCIAKNPLLRFSSGIEMEKAWNKLKLT